MTLGEYCEYIGNPLSAVRMRVLIVPPGESWTALRQFYRKRGAVELPLSDLVKESAWLPMPEEVFERIRDAMSARVANGMTVVLLGMPGYLALLTDENKRAALSALREWVDGAAGLDSVCLLRGDDGTKTMLKDVFANPRYRQGKQLIEIDPAPIAPQSASARSTRLADTSESLQGSAGRTEVMLVGADLAAYIPKACDTFQKYLLHTEEHPHDSSVRRIVVASEGRELPGLSAEVRQILSLRDFARVFYDVDDAGLSEDALRWLCGRGKESTEERLSESLRRRFFPEGGIAKRVLQVFDSCNGAEREAAFWLFKQVAFKGGYLKYVTEKKGVAVVTFRSAYVAGAADCLDDATAYAAERRDAIREANAIASGVDIKLFIERCIEQATLRVAPWMGCGTDAERAELLRRCATDGVVSNVVRDVYPEAAAYLSGDPVFDDETLEGYFKEYRDRKMEGRVTPEFCAKAAQAVLPPSVKRRDALVQQYASDNRCALLVVDAMGAEWLPMLVAMAKKQNLGMHSAVLGMANLPTTTRFNNINWPDVARRLPDIKRLDNIVHNGAETHEVRRAEENLAASLDVIGSYVLPRVAEGLARFDRVLVTADHGSSRLAALAWQSGPRLARTLVCEEAAEIADWRYRERAAHTACPPGMEEPLDGKHWVVRGYDRLPKKGGGQGFEMHGGATLEERLVPVVIFSHTGQFMPKAKPSSKRVQIVEKDDFDL